MAVCILHESPALIVLLRHAEKPNDDKDPNLGDVGYRRAGALPAWLSSQLQRISSIPLSSIGAIYAMKGGTDKHKTLRPIQTVIPLANTASILLNQNYGFGQTYNLVHEILTTSTYSNKVVVICWIHEELGELAKAFGITKPPIWDSKDYDHTWFITLIPTKLSVEPQRLLFGDSSH